MSSSRLVRLCLGLLLWLCAAPRVAAQQAVRCRAPSSWSGGATTKRRRPRIAGFSPGARMSFPRCSDWSGCCCRSTGARRSCPTSARRWRQTRRARPSTASRCAPGERPTSRTACGRWPSAGPGSRRATRRPTGSGAPRRWRSRHRDAALQAYRLGRERLGRGGRAGGRDGAARDHRRRLRDGGARVASRPFAGSRGTGSPRSPRWGMRRPPSVRRSCASSRPTPTSRAPPGVGAAGEDGAIRSEGSAALEAGLPRGASARLGRAAGTGGPAPDAANPRMPCWRRAAPWRPSLLVLRATRRLAPVSRPRRPTPPPASARPRGGCSSGLADDRSAPGSVSSGAASALLTVLIGEGKLSEAAAGFATSGRS